MMKYEINYIQFSSLVIIYCPFVGPCNAKSGPFNTSIKEHILDNTLITLYSHVLLDPIDDTLVVWIHLYLKIGPFNRFMEFISLVIFLCIYSCNSESFIKRFQHLLKLFYFSYFACFWCEKSLANYL